LGLGGSGNVLDLDLERSVGGDVLRDEKVHGAAVHRAEVAVDFGLLAGGWGEGKIKKRNRLKKRNWGIKFERKNMVQKAKLRK
jgi:hypothetical protein